MGTAVRKYLKTCQGIALVIFKLSLKSKPQNRRPTAFLLKSGVYQTEAHAVLAVESSRDNKVQLNRPVIGGNPLKMGQDGPVNKITTIT